MKWPDHDQPPACRRLHAWLNVQDTLRIKQSALPLPDESWYEQVAGRLTAASQPLIWLESCDTDTARAAVHLAEKCKATVHVAQSPGEHVVSAVTSSVGWPGTTLAEILNAATLIIHLGHQHLHDMPMLLSRFQPENCEHLFIDQCPEELLQEELSSEQQSVIQLRWQKAQWLDGLMRTLLAVRDESIIGQRQADELDVTAGVLAERLLASRYGVIIWDQNSLSDESDRLIVERLVELADSVGQITRTTLLPLASDPGRVASKEAVLWLTNRTTPIRYCSGRWVSADYSAGLTLDQWRERYDYRLCIRSLPSDTPLPELDFHALIDGDCNLGQAQRSATHVAYVRSIGVNGSGQLTRGDHGLAAYVPAIDVDDGRRVTAIEVVDAIRRQLDSTSENHLPSDVRSNQP